MTDDLPTRLRAANADLARFTSAEHEAAIEAAAVEIERLQAALARAEREAAMRKLEGTMPDRAVLLDWARDHPPPQSWFDEDLDGLFDGLEREE